jgi:Zn-dependent protease
LTTFQTILFVAPVLLFSVIAHEYAHGYAALRQGDPTAYQLGRLTWNPVKHIDPFMTLLLPAVLLIATHGQMVLGGAKPVPVNPRNYRRYKRGDIIVSLAGVTANLIIAVGCAGAIVLVGLVGRVVPAAGATLAILQVMLTYGVWLNLLLIAFNLIPIPPLDGSHVMKYLLPARWALHYQAFARYGIVVLVALLYFGGSLLTAWMQPAFHAADLLLRAVNPFVLSGVQQWAPQ